MLKFIKYRSPFVLIAISFVCSICSYFEFYTIAFKYLGDIFGYSIVTNTVMYMYYNNKNFCYATRLAVIGLLTLNIFNLGYLYFGINNGMYDLIMISIIVLLIMFLKIKKK